MAIVAVPTAGESAKPAAKAKAVAKAKPKTAAKARKSKFAEDAVGEVNATKVPFLGYLSSTISYMEVRIMPTEDALIVSFKYLSLGAAIAAKLEVEVKGTSRTLSSFLTSTRLFKSEMYKTKRVLRANLSDVHFHGGGDTSFETSTEAALMTEHHIANRANEMHDACAELVIYLKASPASVPVIIHPTSATLLNESMMALLSIVAQAGGVFSDAPCATQHLITVLIARLDRSVAMLAQAMLARAMSSRPPPNDFLG